ncbi:MAG: hypothetical protein M0R38_04380 [Bacteroidia bacterium]|nr:hypothetical protein [Bacteroidia bacterium]
MSKKIPIQKPLSDDELKIILKRVVWDYNISPDDLLAIFKGEMEGRGIDTAQLQAKLLNGYQWHNLIKWFGYETVRTFLRDEVIKAIFPASYRQKLLNAKTILRT